MRLACLTVCLIAAALLAACGGSSTHKSPPGSAQNPLVAKATPDEESAVAPQLPQPGYQKLVERQSSRTHRRFTPCNLVTRSQARSILGAPVQSLIEAPQGPTCIYRTQDGKRFITVAVQSTSFRKLTRQIDKPQAVSVSNRTAYCGRLGQPMLYVALGSRRVLSVAAPCNVAKRFAITAVRRLHD